MIPSETIDKYMEEKDFARLRDAIFENADEYLQIRNLETPCYATDISLSSVAKMIDIYSNAFPVECGWSAEAMKAIFFLAEGDRTKNIRRAFEELEKAGYAEKVFAGDANGKFARYNVCEESVTPEARRFITTKTVWALDDEDLWNEAVAMAGRELTPDEVLVVFRSAYGALPEKNAFRIEKWDHDASVYKICDAELARRSDVCIAEIIHLRKM